MDERQTGTRRDLLARLTGVAGLMLTLPWTRGGSLRAQSHPTPQPMASPNAPGSQAVPGGLDGQQLAHQSRRSTISPLMWSQIKSDTDRLLEMVTDFKAKVDQTNLSATLSLPLIKEAHVIEKMAKDIQQRMRT